MTEQIQMLAPALPSPLKQNLIDIVTAHCRNGGVDMHRTEIQRAYEEQVANRRIKDGTISREMREIFDAGWLLRSPKKRASRVGVDAASLPSPVAGFCYYAPGVGTGRPPAAMTSQGGAGRAAVAAGAPVVVPAVVAVPAGSVVASVPDFY